MWDSCRSWRDLFLDKNAPPIVAVEREIGDGADDRVGGQADEEGLEEEEDGELEEVEREVQFDLDLKVNLNVEDPVFENHSGLCTFRARLIFTTRPSRRRQQLQQQRRTLRPRR